MNNPDLQEIMDKSLEEIEEFEIYCQQFINLQEQLLDGWYCIKSKKHIDVYYQERGCKHWPIYRFSEYRKALLFAVSCSQNLQLDIREDELLSIN